MRQDNLKECLSVARLPLSLCVSARHYLYLTAAKIPLSPERFHSNISLSTEIPLRKLLKDLMTQLGAKNVKIQGNSKEIR